MTTLYKLPVVLHEPSAESGDLYLAEIPLLPGCRAWGETLAEAVENVQSVAMAFLESYREHGDELPEELRDLAVEPGNVSEVFVAVGG